MLSPGSVRANTAMHTCLGNEMFQLARYSKVVSAKQVVRFCQCTVQTRNQNLCGSFSTLSTWKVREEFTGNWD